MKKKNTFIRVLALSLCAIVLCLSLASCAAGDKIKTGAADAWDKVKDGAEDIYNSVTDKSTGDIELDPISSAHIRLTSLETSTVSTDASYKTILKASDFANCTSYTNAAGATYVMYEQRVGNITALTGAEHADYWTATAGDKPIVAVDGNFSYVCVVLPTGYSDAVTWAAAANDFSVTVTPVIEKTLTATVLPSSASDQRVTWSVSCSDSTVNVPDYIRLLTFQGETTNTVYVLALQPFYDLEFTILCTTVVGGYTAECKVTYKGMPQFMDFHIVNDDGSEINIDAKYPFKANATYTVKPVLGNVFQAVGDEYNQFEIVGYGVEGTINVLAGEYYYQQGRWSEYENKDIELAEYLSDFIKSVSISDEGYLTLELGIAVTEFDDGSITGGIDHYYRMRYGSGAENITFWVQVRENNSGTTNILRFTIEPVVESVSLSSSTMTF